MSQEFLILSETADGKKLINQSSVHVTRLWSCTQVYLFQGCSKFWAAFQVASHSWESMTAWSWSTRQGCCKYSAATNQTSAILRECVIDVTSVPVTSWESMTAWSWSTRQGVVSTTLLRTKPLQYYGSVYLTSLPFRHLLGVCDCLSWSTRQGCCKYNAATNQTSAIVRKCVFDITSVGQRFSPRAFNSVKAEVKFHLECKLRFSCVQALLWQMHWSNSAAPSVEFLCQVVTFYLHEGQPH